MKDIIVVDGVAFWIMNEPSRCGDTTFSSSIPKSVESLHF